MKSRLLLFVTLLSSFLPVPLIAAENPNDPGRERRVFTDPPFVKRYRGSDVPDAIALRMTIRLLSIMVGNGDQDHALDHVARGMKQDLDEAAEFMEYLISVHTRMFNEEKALMESTLCSFNDPVITDADAVYRLSALDDAQSAMYDKYFAVVRAELPQNTYAKLMTWIRWRKQGMNVIDTDVTKMEGLGLPEGYHVSHVEGICSELASGSAIL